MIVLSPILFIVTALVLALMAFIVKVLAGKSSGFFRGQQKELGNVNGYIEELVEGLRIVKVFGYEDSAITEFKKRNEAYRQAATEANFFAAVVMPVVGNLSNIMYAVTAMAGGVLVVVGRFDIGSLAAYLQYTRQVGMPVQQISNQLNAVLAALAGAERVFEMMDQRPEVDEGCVQLVGATIGVDGAIEPSRNGAHPTHWAWHCPDARELPPYTELKGDVRLSHVTFGYVPDKVVLDDVTLWAKPGRRSLSSDRPARARPPSRTSSTASTRSTRG